MINNKFVLVNIPEEVRRKCFQDQELRLGFILKTNPTQSEECF